MISFGLHGCQAHVHRYTCWPKPHTHTIKNKIKKNEYKYFELIP